MSERVVLDRDDLRRTLVRIAHEIIEKNAGTPRDDDPDDGGSAIAIVGIHTRGAVLARRLHAHLEELIAAELPLGDIDISFYRDDVGGRAPADSPVVHSSHLDFELEGRTIVLVDRGHRELPIRPDYTGKNLPTARDERVYVRLEEIDGIDEVAIGEAVPVSGTAHTNGEASQ